MAWKKKDAAEERPPFTFTAVQAERAEQARVIGWLSVFYQIV